MATRRFGPALHAQGHNWVGKLVLRYWPDQGGWWEAKIGEYSTSRSKHRLIYDADTDKVQILPPCNDLIARLVTTSAHTTCLLLTGE